MKLNSRLLAWSAHSQYHHRATARWLIFALVAGSVLLAARRQ